MENIDNYYVSKLDEKIYHATDSNDELKIKKELESFIQELVKKRYHDSYEGGAQACAIIFPKTFAAKIAENNGASSHFVTSINLVEFLNHNDKYLGNSGAYYFQLSKKERTELYEAIQLRIVANPDELMIAITSSVDIKSSFQLKVLKDIILSCKNLMDKKIYKNISIGLSTPNIKIEFEDWKEGREEVFINDLDKTSKKL